MVYAYNIHVYTFNMRISLKILYKISFSLYYKQPIIVYVYTYYEKKIIRKVSLKEKINVCVSRLPPNIPNYSMNETH